MRERQWKREEIREESIRFSQSVFPFFTLAGYDLKYLQRTEVQPLELARQRFPRPELSELVELLPSALSFLFVRDPFERILSAYRNKLEGNRNSFYKALGTKIVHRYRRRSLNVAFPRCGPTFEEFVRFLIQEHAAGNRFDEHWAPVYSFCTPCSVNFTIIGKTETFQRDSEFIIRQAGLESLLLGKLPRRKLRKIGNQARSGVKSEELVERYFGELDRSTLDQLLNIYRIDFELFDYDYLKYYNMVHSWSLEQSPTAPQAKSGPRAGTDVLTTSATLSLRTAAAPAAWMDRWIEEWIEIKPGQKYIAHIRDKNLIYVPLYRDGSVTVTQPKLYVCKTICIYSTTE